MITIPIHNYPKAADEKRGIQTHRIYCIVSLPIGSMTLSVLTGESNVRELFALIQQFEKSMHTKSNTIFESQLFTYKLLCDV